MLLPVTHYGDKAKLTDEIAVMLPEHTHYVEPFAGSLSVLLAKKPSRLETVNDLDRDLMIFWKVLRERPADLTRVCALTPHSRAELEAAYGDLSDPGPNPVNLTGCRAGVPTDN
ncbi:DNA adenine methylase [Actinoallomurus purpureus]|uniref:DNA adenine methylase n=1 Tax=Actinoallomurus purpureus TaxID=478114 RepID=UPI002092B513|nr:DNA adenine methylase [Actinoallomurus purpureus]MCO6004010.1 DNA adenine methylase [Actinoallomurus purpureus]